MPLNVSHLNKEVKDKNSLGYTGGEVYGAHFEHLGKTAWQAIDA
jgi:hypothetical protein